ncbi:uncharacterized protein DFL_009373 [Arthrobotrys flagrans]|uniref:Uncharacterized protein n=1 Tax=Arthrobotrys flagrans TaxID=97331 RepID=A0A436ZRG2_ARTFL|nr:hypothetical protein DFL_009373 [Arthrobotrys flagrans]
MPELAEQLSGDECIIERASNGACTPPSDSEPDAYTDEPAPDQKDTAENISKQDVANKLAHEHTNNQQMARPSHNSRYHAIKDQLLYQIFITLGEVIVGAVKKTSILVYQILKWSMMALMPLFIVGIISLHLGVLVAPESTCELFDSYAPESLSLSTLSPCSWEPIVQEPDPLFAQAISRSSAFRKLQGVTSKNDNLPLQITETRHEFRKLLMELRVGTADASSMASLFSLIPEYNELLDDVVDGMHDCRAKTRSLVDDTITYTDWTNDALRRIDEQNPLLTKLLYTRWWSNEKSFAETAVERVFDEFAGKLEELAGNVYSKYVQLGRNLKAFERKLESIAIALNMGQDTFEKTKLAEQSFWKDLMGPQLYRQKMEDLERKANLCSDFYKSSMEALKIVDATALALSEARAGIRHLREEVGKATLPRGKEWSLNLTIRLLENSAAELQASKYRIGYLRAHGV